MGTSKLNKAVWKGSLLVFSGRPNPQWTADAGTAAGVERQIETAAIHASQQPWPSQLGYSGVGLQKAGVQYVVFDGRIAVTKGGKTVYKTDEGRVIEKTLLQTAPEDLIAPLKTYINKEVNL
jgi:hypothetical protein